MWISAQKKKENIGEYILYMWQIEDIIRSYNLDLLKIEEEIIAKYQLNEEQEEQLFDWYKTLVMEMREEGIVKSGHLKRTTEIINELNYLHNNLLNVKKDFEYSEKYKVCKEDIEALKDKMGVNPGHDIQICFNGLYATLLLKLQKKEILKETQEAMQRISKFIAHLVKEYMALNKKNV